MPTLRQLTVLSLLLILVQSACVTRNPNTNGPVIDGPGGEDTTDADTTGGDTTSLPINLLSNGSFEIDGEPSIEGWRSYDLYDAKVIPDPPPGGGSYCLTFNTFGFPPMIVWTAIPGVENGDILSLSAFVKWLPPGYGRPGIGFSSKPMPIGAFKGKEVVASDSVWAQLVLVDTIRLEVGDTLYVFLFGDWCTACYGGSSQFDLVSVERVTH